MSVTQPGAESRFPTFPACEGISALCHGWIAEPHCLAIMQSDNHKTRSRTAHAVGHPVIPLRTRKLSRCIRYASVEGGVSADLTRNKL